MTLKSLKPDLYVSVLGAEGSGKTTYIAALLYSVMHANVKGGEHIRMQFPDTEEDAEIRKIAHQSIATINESSDESSGDYIRRIWKAIYQESNQSYSGTVTCQDIFIKIHSDQIPLLHTEQIVCVRDIPGGWVKDTRKWDDGSRQIREQLKASNALVIILDAVALSSSAGYNVEQDKLLEVLIKALENYADESNRRKSPLPVSVIFSKCDRLATHDIENLKDNINALRKSLNLCFHQNMIAYFNGSAFGADPKKQNETGEKSEKIQLPVASNPFFQQVFSGFYHLFNARKVKIIRQFKYSSLAIASVLCLILGLWIFAVNWNKNAQYHEITDYLQPDQNVEQIMPSLAKLAHLYAVNKKCTICFAQTKKIKQSMRKYLKIASEKLSKKSQLENSQQSIQSANYYQQIANTAKQITALFERHEFTKNPDIETLYRHNLCKNQFQLLLQYANNTTQQYENRLQEWKKFQATCPQTVVILAQQQQKNAYRLWRMTQAQKIIANIQSELLHDSWITTRQFLQKLPKTKEDIAIAHNVLLILGQELLQYAQLNTDDNQKLAEVSQLSRQWPLITDSWQLPENLIVLSQEIANAGHLAISKQTHMGFNAAIASISQIKGDCERRLEAIWDLYGRYPNDPYRAKLKQMLRLEKHQCEQIICSQIRKKAPYLDALKLEQKINSFLLKFEPAQCKKELESILNERKTDIIWKTLRELQSEHVAPTENKAFEYAEKAYKQFILQYQDNPTADEQMIAATKNLAKIEATRKNHQLIAVQRCWKNMSIGRSNISECANKAKSYMARYPSDSENHAQLSKMLTFINTIAKRQSYAINIIEGEFIRSIDTEKVYVTLSINGIKLDHCTTKAIEAEKPIWNAECTILWQANNNLSIKVWSKASWGKDKLIFRRQLKGLLALHKICGIKKKKIRALWDKKAKDWIKIRPVGSDHCDAFFPAKPYLLKAIQ